MRVIRVDNSNQLQLMPAGEIQEMVMVKNQIYEREIQAYSEFLLEAEKLLVSVNDPTRFAPKCFHTTNEPKDLLIFEDMKETGYKPFSRNEQLNFNQALPIIVKLAKLHAVSAVLYEKNPPIMDRYLEGSISTNPDRQDFLVHYRNCARTLGLVAENEWGAEWKEIATKLINLQHTVVDKGCKLYLRDE
jgi:Ecdysteroid kinase-like family